MKPISILRNYAAILLAAWAVLTASCTKDSPEEFVTPEEPVASITMTTLATEVGFYMQMKPGTDSIVIDWGDGEGSKMYAPEGSDSYIGSYSFSYLNVSHSYSSASEHNITITGDSIVYLDCVLNQLTALDVSSNTALEELWCSGNQLTALDVSSNTALRVFYCGGNQLTTLDVSGNTALKELYCYNNQLTVCALNDLFRTLPNSVGYIVVWDNPGENDCNYSIAQEKGWRFQYKGPPKSLKETKEELHLSFITQFLNNKNYEKR